MIQPAKPDVLFDSPEREYVFIMDVSGSMSGEPLENSKELIPIVDKESVNNNFPIYTCRFCTVLR